jgi:carbon-monoxide dehydrogenase medium subunit
VFPSEFEYFVPGSVEEALALLATHGEDAKILAGGQSLLPMMKLRIASPRYLIDVNRIPSLTGHRLAGDRIVFGALCRHAEIFDSPIVREHFPIMRDSASLTADVQVRNRGTIGGSLSHADPNGDWPTSLYGLGTQVTVSGPAGARTLPIEEFIVDAYTTQMGPDEMLTEIAVPLWKGTCGGAYVKFERRAGDFAVASVGVQVELDGGGRCRRLAVSLGAVGPTPIRAREVEQLYLGNAPSAALAQRARGMVEQAAQPFEDTRGSVDYKRHLAGVLFGKALAAALDRARGVTVDTLHV